MLIASRTATAHATVIPTIGLLPAQSTADGKCGKVYKYKRLNDPINNSIFQRRDRYDKYTVFPRIRGVRHPAYHTQNRRRDAVFFFCYIITDRNKLLGGGIDPRLSRGSDSPDNGIRLLRRTRRKFLNRAHTTPQT